MVKIKKKILALISILCLLFNQVLAVPLVFAQEASPSAQVVTLESPSSLATSSAELTESPTPQPSPSSTPAPTSNWQDVVDNMTTTKDSVVLDHLYTAPQNSKVTLKFNKLPENKGKLTIKEVTLTDEQVNQTKALSKTAYDISSDMENGTFEYTLTLPTPKTDNVEVKASEDGQTFVTLGGVSAQTDTLTITGLNHFTLFVVSNPTASSNGQNSEIGTTNWTSTNKVYSNDSQYATATLNNETSNYLKARDYNFAIPADAIIIGITVNIDKFCTGASCKDASVKLIKGGTVSGDDKADTLTDYPTTDTYKSYGGRSDLWGLIWTPSDINNANFGVAFASRNQTSQNRTVNVDHVKVEIAYDRPPVATTDSATTPEDTPVSVAVLANDTDADGDALSLSSVSNAVNGSVTIDGSNAVFTPAANFNGAASFEYTVSDGELTATGTANVDVAAVNDTPVANADSAQLNQ
ncbi:cadherin-like domain-containing protein [Candidatus Daviesbacteria bacterium]|nr:cadherin-like domain-containing protein [Candidatus Daviesbacteria bacterium]